MIASEQKISSNENKLLQKFPEEVKTVQISIITI